MRQKLNFYRGTVLDAYELIYERRLRHADPVSRGWCVYEFASAGVMIRFMLEFGLDCGVEANAVTVRDEQRPAAQAIILSMGEGVLLRSTPVFAVWLWGSDAETAFDEAFV